MSRNKVWFEVSSGRFSITYYPRTLLGCLTALLLMLLLFFGSIFLVIKFYAVVLPILLRGLGLSLGVGIALLVTIIFCARLNVPLYLVAIQQNQVRYELFPIWLLRAKNLAYRSRFQPHTFVGINIMGGLIPLLLALYQLSRSSPLAILTIAAIVTLLSYCFVRVVPGVGIFFRPGTLWLMVLITALLALWFGARVGGDSSLSIAFAGGVIGTLVGADLLHLKEIQPEKAIVPLNIGGAGLNDGIALCGLYSLLLAEWLPNLVAFLKLEFL
jgi:uncharacterized membrane protein